jgi:hypothetical protein
MRPLTIVAVLVTLLSYACGPARLGGNSPQAGSDRIRIVNISAATLEVYVGETPGMADRFLGEVPPSATAEFSLASELRSAAPPMIRAYRSGSMRRSMVHCSSSRKDGRMLIVDCGGG